MRLLAAVVVLVVALVAIGLLTGRTVRNDQPAGGSSDEFMVKLRYETSDDLVPELDGFHTGQVCNLRCSDGVPRPVKIVLLDRGLGRAGIILVQSRSPVGGNMGAVAYDPRGMGFVRLSRLRDHCD